jgi:protein gp37
MAKRQKHRCRLCYEFVPHPHLERLEKLNPRQKPKKIFIDSMWDWNAKGVKRDWIKAILAKMRECSQHTFQILSKRPVRYSRFSYPPNVWLGTSISANADKHRVSQLCEASPNNLRFVSVEPLHEELNFGFSKRIDWIIVGAETGNRKGKIVPNRKWVQQIIVNARKNKTPIFIKENVKWNETIREFPTCHD